MFSGFFSKRDARAAWLAVAVTFPGVNWETIDASTAGWDHSALRTVERFTFGESETGAAKPSSEFPYRTDALLIVTGGRIVFERYARDTTAVTRHFGWSVAKSVTMGILGTAVKEKIVSLEDSVSKWIPELKGTDWDSVKLVHLLSMSSGRKWNEGYEGSPFTSNVVAALYRDSPSADYAKYALTVGRKLAEPGARLNYASADTNILMLCLKRALGSKYETYPWDKFFYPVGMTSAVLERDLAGTFIGSSYFHATARDFARLGHLFLNHGMWNGAEVIPSEFARLANEISPAHPKKGEYHTTQDVYGHGWWLNRSIPEAGIPSAAPAVPEDSYMAQGHYGQIVFVIPAWDTVVVRLGSDPGDKKFDFAKLGTLLSAARVGMAPKKSPGAVEPKK